MWNFLKKNGTDELIDKTEIVTDVENQLWLLKGKGREREIGRLGLTYEYYYPKWLRGKESICNAEDPGDMDLIPGLGTSLGEGTGNPL